MPFGSDREFDRRLGFRFSCTPIDEEVFERHDEGENAGNDDESSEDDNDNGDQDGSEGSDDDTEDELASIHRYHAVALNRGTFDWPSRAETHRFLFETIRQCSKYKLLKEQVSGPGSLGRPSEDRALCFTRQTQPSGENQPGLLTPSFYRNRHAVGNPLFIEAGQHAVALRKGLPSGCRKRQFCLPRLSGLDFKARPVRRI